MVHLAERPLVVRRTKPSPLHIFITRVTKAPSPPQPGLLSKDISVSGGCETIAATTPATRPDDKDIVVRCVVVVSGLDKSILASVAILSATHHCVVNLAIV